MRFYEISKTRKKNAQKWPYKRDLICLLFFTFSKVKKRPQKRGEKPDYNVSHFNYETPQKHVKSVVHNQENRGR